MRSAWRSVRGGSCRTTCAGLAAGESKRTARTHRRSERTSMNDLLQPADWAWLKLYAASHESAKRDSIKKTPAVVRRGKGRTGVWPLSILDQNVALFVRVPDVHVAVIGIGVDHGAVAGVV